MKQLGLSAVLCFLLALVLGASALLIPVAALHLVFAVGILPLIFGAMLHFVPVLTRSTAPHPGIAALPFIALLVGIPVVLAIQGILPRSALHAAATADLAIAGKPETLPGAVAFSMLEKEQMAALTASGSG